MNWLSFYHKNFQNHQNESILFKIQILQKPQKLVENYIMNEFQNQRIINLLKNLQ